MTFTTKRIISHSVSLLAEDVGGKIVVVLDRKEGPWHRCMRIRPVSRLAAGSLRVITELHGRMDDVTKLQRDRQPAILPWKARERDASPGCIVIGQDRSSRKSRIVANRDWRGIFHCEIVILSFVQIIVSINHPTSLSNFFFHLCCNIGKIGEMKFCIKIGTNSCKIMFRCSWNLKIEKFF